MAKKGQVAIFVIIAMAVVIVLLGVYFYPTIREAVAPEVVSPSVYLQSCVEPEVKTIVNLLSSQGGVQNPPAYLNYKGTKIRYLCYTSGYYQTCMVQEPMLISTFESELKRLLTARIESCAKNMKAEFEKRGYDVEMGNVKTNISLGLKKINIEFFTPLKISKAEAVQSFESMDASINSEIYEILSIATSIVAYEAAYGDSETTLYMSYYPNIKVEKMKFENSIKLYKLTNTDTGESFMFASRSLAWPEGYY